MTLDKKDIWETVYTNATPTVGMTLTHTPTGLSVKGSSVYRFRLREQLMDELEKLVAGRE